MAVPPRPVMRVFRALPESVRQRAVRAAAPSYTLGAQARVEREDGRILLVKASYRWRWGMPGGLLDAGEAPADAAVRETREETGLAIELVGEPLVLVETEMQRVNFIYDAVPAEGANPDEIRAQATEILELGWFALDELPATAPDDYHKILVRQLHEQPGPQVVVTESLPGDGSITDAQ